jgi:hypothetical protein
MKTTILRFHAICGLAIVMAGCEKPAMTSAPGEKETSPPRETKSVRHESSDPTVTRSSLRVSLDQALENVSSESRDEALNDVIEDAFAVDTELAQEAFKQLSAKGDERNMLIEHFAMRFSENDPDAAAQWARSLETDEERSLAFGNIALVLSEKNPEAAAKLLSDSGVASRDFDVSVVQVVQRWSEKSPENAAAWVVRFDPGEAREAGLKAISSSWLEQDVKAAFGWIAGLQDPAIREEAISGMAESILELPDSDQAEILRNVSPDIRDRFEKLKAQADEE